MQIRIQIVDCVIEEGNHINNWAISGNWTNKSEPESPPGAGMPKMQMGNGSEHYKGPHKMMPPPSHLDHYSISVQGSDQDPAYGPGSGAAYQGPINNMIVVARNRLHGAGILVSGHSHNVLVDANTITSSPVGAVRMRSAACFAEPFASCAPIQISSSPAISCALSGEAAAIAVMTGSFSGACERTQSSPRGGGTSCAKTVDSKVMPSGASLLVPFLMPQ